VHPSSGNFVEFFHCDGDLRISRDRSCWIWADARGGPKQVVSAPSAYFQHCGLFMAPGAPHVHDALPHGDKGMDLRPNKYDWMMRSLRISSIGQLWAFREFCVSRVTTSRSDEGDAWRCEGLTGRGNSKRHKMAADHIDYFQSAARLVPCGKTEDSQIKFAASDLASRGVI
jgi:hypothetical protein